MSVTIRILKATDPRTKNVFLDHNREKFDIYSGKGGGEFRIVVEPDREDPVTGAQLRVLMAMNYEPPDGLTKGHASIIIQKLRGTYRPPRGQRREGKGVSKNQ